MNATTQQLVATKLDQRDLQAEVTTSLTKAWDQVVSTGADSLILGAELTELTARTANVSVKGGILVARLGNSGMERIQHAIQDVNIDDMFTSAPNLKDIKDMKDSVIKTINPSK